ncbi:MAG: methyltransferase [Chloroflexi bacterium]|nr:methyltransferase [Chloroflexota bacterium]
MNSRERVLATFNHQEPDRVPIDFDGHRSSGVMAIAYARLRRHLGLPVREVYVYDFVQQLALVDDDVLDRFGADAVQLGRGFARDPRDWADWELPDGTPCKIPSFVKPVQKNGDWVLYGDEGQVIAIQKQGTLFFETADYPLAGDPDDAAERLRYYLDQVVWWRVGVPPSPLGFDPQGLAALAAGARALRESTDRAIVGIFGGNLLDMGQLSYRMDNFLCDMLANPRQVHTFLDRLTELHLADLDKFLTAVGPSIDIVVFADDLGMQTGPQLSPRMYREFLKPRHALLWNRAKQLRPGLKVFLHCCGGVYSLIPHLIEAGLDALNPVQTTCAGMEPGRLKREFGRDLVFWGGGCDTRETLPRGTPEQVRQDVRRRMEIFSPGGGFVFQPVHNIMADVPPENVVAMFEEALAFRP